MPEIVINQQIASLRKNKGITQEELAVHLGVTNQTVSKWELAACCPDIQLLPDIADYFGVSIDELFGRVAITGKGNPIIDSVPWDDDDTLRAVIFAGKELVGDSKKLSEFTFEYEGDALNIDCHCNISCGNVLGSANAGGDISCGNIEGPVNAGDNINCKNIDGPVSAGCDIKCESINGAVSTGGNIN